MKRGCPTYRVLVSRPAPTRRWTWWAALTVVLAIGCSSVGDSAVPPTTRKVTVATVSGEAPAEPTTTGAGPFPPPAGVEVQLDQPYGEGGSFDVYRPATGGPHPLVVVFPGRTGGKVLYATLAGAVAARGAVVVVADYRARADQPGPLGDLRCAVDVARAKAPSWNADPARLVLVGVTWGAVAAVGEGLAGPWQKTPTAAACSIPITAERPVPLAIVGVVGDYAFYGPPGTETADFRTYSPYGQLAGAPPVPIVVIHGTPDRLAVDPAVSNSFADAAKAAGHPVSVSAASVPNLALTGLAFDEDAKQLTLVEPGTAAAGLTPTVTAIAKAAGL